MGAVQEDAQRVIATQGWPTKSVASRMLYLTSELGELAKALIALGDAARDDEVDRMKALKDGIGHEIYDIAWNLADLATILNIDLNKAVADKRAIMDSRRWDTAPK